ncbi:MAG: hypothetical protein U1E02_42535 [Hydrogenophaga sp.]|uniref:hypothetical protein n=1 Tax=Hydrogenophaga sp. TaxID=1904254 RepID=UPI00273159CB|nr:hypothetical protein [Hydrogenophaga sp.]MDP2249421.1 hypothetical protein [Hydrogenophaga sp.]MDZ4130804.1 hypothetical protein [Hydrogenophaga sp.]
MLKDIFVYVPYVFATIFALAGTAVLNKTVAPFLFEATRAARNPDTFVGWATALWYLLGVLAAQLSGTIGLMGMLVQGEYLPRGEFTFWLALGVVGLAIVNAVRTFLSAVDQPQVSPSKP